MVVFTARQVSLRNTSQPIKIPNHVFYISHESEMPGAPAGTHGYGMTIVQGQMSRQANRMASLSGTEHGTG